MPDYSKLRRRQDTLGDIPPDIRPDKPGELVGGSPSFMAQTKRSRPPALLNNTVFVNMGFSIGTKSEEALPANAGRNYLLIQNRSAGAIEISFGNKANGFDSIEIASGGNYEPYVVPFSSINVKASAAASQVVILEGYGTQVT